MQDRQSRPSLTHNTNLAPNQTHKSPKPTPNALATHDHPPLSKQPHINKKHHHKRKKPHPHPPPHPRPLRHPQHPIHRSPQPDPRRLKRIIHLLRQSGRIADFISYRNRNLSLQISATNSTSLASGVYLEGVHFSASSPSPSSGPLVRRSGSPDSRTPKTHSGLWGRALLCGNCLRLRRCSCHFPRMVVMGRRESCRGIACVGRGKEARRRKGGSEIGIGIGNASRKRRTENRGCCVGGVFGRGRQ